MNAADLESQVRDAMRAAGIEPPDCLELDGKLHRFPTKAGNPDDDAGWYVFHADGIPAGVFGDWRGSSFKFVADPGRPRTQAEDDAAEQFIRQAQEKRRMADKARHDDAALKARRIWDGSKDAPPDHPYLARKKIGPHGARVASDGRLIVPLFGIDGALASLGYIDAAGEKRFMPGGKVAGSFWVIGSPGKRVFIAEGFATAASIHEATGEACAVAYSAGNLKATGQAFRAAYPAAELVFVADNDESGTGEVKAREAAALVQGRMVLIPTPGQDANDYVNAGGDLKGLLGKVRTRTIVSMESIRTADIPARQWAIADMIPAGDLTIIGGRKRQGKTWFTLQALEAIASGHEFLGRATTAGRVLYWPSELNKTGLKERAQRWDELPEGMNAVAQEPDDPPTPRGKAFIAELDSIINDGGYSVVAVDMLGAFTPAGSDSNAYEIGDFFLELRRVAFRTGAAIVGTWHTGKADRDDPVLGLIGSTGIGGQAGSIVTITKSKGSSVRITVSGNHAREQDFTVQQVDGMFEGEEPVDLSDIMNQPSPNERHILDALAMYPGGVSVGDLAEAMEKKHDAMDKALRRMKDKGLVLKQGQFWFAKLNTSTRTDTDKAGQCPDDVRSQNVEKPGQTRTNPLGVVRMSGSMEEEMSVSKKVYTQSEALTEPGKYIPEPDEAPDVPAASVKPAGPPRKEFFKLPPIAGRTASPPGEELDIF